MNKKILIFFFTTIMLTTASCNCEASPKHGQTSISSIPFSRNTDLTSGAVTGIIIDGETNSKLDKAIVRVQATDVYVETDTNGNFKLDLTEVELPLYLTAWAEGYFINGVEVVAGTQDVTIALKKISELDNQNYTWVSSIDSGDEASNETCSHCHFANTLDIRKMLPVDQWLVDIHSNSSANPRFLTIYNGTDLEGNQSPQTIFVSKNSYQKNASGYDYVALPPDLSQPYYGPGYKLDFPESAGNCALCHAPAAAAYPGQKFAVDFNELGGEISDGIPCDFCHKVWDVILDENSLPDTASPGLLSYILRRPENGHQYFAGPFDDVAPGEDTYTPVQQESAFCAPCHFGVFWDEQIYNSYGEWLDSPYSNPETGQSCQDCHMPQTGIDHFASIDSGGNIRNPETIYSHKMPGAQDKDLLHSAITLSAKSSIVDNMTQVEVGITNDQTGHHVPTGHPGRHLILVVRALDQEGNPISLIDGPVLPDWVGVGDYEEGYFAGLPGETYAKILREDWTGYYPSIAYWNPTTTIQDNRIAAFDVETSEYWFDYSRQDITIDINLIFRHTFIETMEWKDWEVEDILIDSITLTQSK